LRNPNGDGLEGHKSANEVVDEDVHENVSDNSKTISQPFDNVHSRPIYVRKFPSQVPSSGSSMEDDEKIDSSLRPFDDRLKMELQLYEKSERCKVSSKGKKRCSKNPKSFQNSPIPTEIAKEALDFGKRLGLSTIGDEFPTIRRITKSLRKELKNKR